MSQTIPDPDYDDPKETFAFFGLTFYYAQVLEQGIVNLAVALSAKGVPGVTVEDVKTLYESMNEKTFGQVSCAAQKVINISNPLAADLEAAVKKRNFLAHRFFVERDIDHMTAHGRVKMINELRDMLLFLQNVDKRLDKVWHAASEPLGINPDWWEMQLERYKKEHGILET
jgi:hypothetical protein